MGAALGSPNLGAILDAWRWRPVPLVAVALAVTWYATARRTPFRWRRAATFTAGLAIFLWTTCGVLGVYATSLFWIWTARLLVLLLVVPVVLMAAQPADLTSRRAGRRARNARVRRSGRRRLVSSRLIGPALIPLVTTVCVFGPIPGLSVRSPVADSVLILAVVCIGCVVAGPLVTTQVERSSQAVGLTLAVGLLELIVTTIPGIVLRVRNTPGSFFAHRAVYGWSPHPLHDQRLAGGLLWCVGALLGLPFCVTIFWRWLRADAKEAAATDVVLDAERIAHGTDPDSTFPVADPPWWLSDNDLRDRYRDTS
jgi:putative membrane protein